MKTWHVILLLGVLAAALHFWRLGTPREVIFDEVHFGKFVTAYCCTGARFFDIHPPHGKLFIAGTAKLLGYPSTSSGQVVPFDFEHIGQAYGEVSPVALRLFPALMGILLPLIFYSLLRQLGVSQPLSLLGGAAVVFDNAILVQTRIIALDGLLLAATFGSLAAFLWSETQTGRKMWGGYILAGVLAGLAAGTKFTGLAALGLLGILVVIKLVRSFMTPTSAKGGDSPFARGSKFAPPYEGGVRCMLQGGVVLLAAFVIYTAGWGLHFALLTQPGEGDVWGLPTGNFWQDTVNLHKTMLSANYNLTATHPDESPWWSWPVMLTSVFYWSGDSGEIIYFLGNPVVWWGGTLLFVWAFFLARRRVWQKGWIVFVGFLIAMLPLVRVPRALFLYHYLTPLLFGMSFGLVWLDTILSSPEKRWRVAGGAMLVLALTFAAFSPLTFGWRVSPSWLSALYWLPDWR